MAKIKKAFKKKSYIILSRGVHTTAEAHQYISHINKKTKARKKKYCGWVMHYTISNSKLGNTI